VFAIVMLAVAVLLVYTVWPKSSGHANVSVSNHAALKPGASRAAPVVHVTAAAAGWRLGSPLSRAVAFSDSGSILAAGGLDSAQNTASAVQRIDPGSGAITASGSLTVPVHDAAGATIEAKHFVFGGGAQHVSDVVQLLEPNGPSTVVGHLPQPRADLAAATIGSTAYLVGGYDGTNATRDVLATSDGAVFRTVAQLPFGVRYPAVAALGNQVYVFGGELGGVESDAVQQIDVSTGTARVVAQLPSPRTEATAVTMSGRIYVVGGLAGGVASSDVIGFDPTTNHFSFDGQLPAPMADSALATVGAGSFLLGGEAATVSSEVTVLQEATSAATPAASVRPFAGLLLIADRGNNRLIVVDADKQRSWIYPSSSKPAPPGGFYFPDDAFFADHGRSIITNQEENHTIVRIAFPSGALQWTYGHPKIAGSTAGFLNQPDDAFLLRDGTYVVADALNCRILHISATRQPLAQIGTTGNCVHDPPRSVGYPNGDTPLADGNLLVSEIHGSWISEYTLAGALVWTVHLPITYPSDPQQIGPDLYLVSDYATPGGIFEFTREGRIVWTYRPTSGERMLDHPSLAERLPNGLIAVNDDYRHRVAFIDPTTETIVWQYGQTDRPGTGADQLNTPDGFDVLLPDASTPLHTHTG
jgi:outer membrane protein assembly factor BamB